MFNAETPTQQLLQRIDYLEFEWQKAVDENQRLHEHLKLHSTRGFPPKPKKRGRVDKLSVRHANRDTARAAKGIVPGFFTWEAAHYFIDWYREEGPMFDRSVLVVLENFVSWLPMILLLLGSIWVMVLVFKALEEYK